ncbi:MAG: exonuclease domain-containing protein [Treponemataceae bacterium]
MNFIAIDFETANHDRNSAISIGLVHFKNGKIVDSAYSLIKPPSLYIREDFTDIHGLTVEDVENEDLFPEVLAKTIDPFIKKATATNKNIPFVAHNSPFDKSVLDACLAYYEIKSPLCDFEWECSLKKARQAWKELESHSLTSLADHFGIVYDAHNALDDAKTCGEIFIKAHHAE